MDAPAGPQPAAKAAHHDRQVSPRTVSTYFPSKEDLVFPERERWLESLRDRMAARETGVSALEAMRGWVEDSLEEWVAREDELRIRRRLIETDARLQARDRPVMAEMAGILRHEVARDLGVPEEDMVARTASAATIAVLDAVDEHFAQVTEASLRDSISDIERRVRQAIRFVEAGIRAAGAESGGQGGVS